MHIGKLLVVSAAGAALGACYWPHFHHHGAYRQVSSLDCPASQGELTRKAAAADGKSCDYVTPSGDPVTLQLISLDGATASEALTPIETKLRAEVPAAAGAAGADKGQGRVDIDLPGIHIHASGHDNDGDSQVRIGQGVSVDSSNTASGTDNASAGGVAIEAHDKGAQISVNETRFGERRDFILASDVPGPDGYKVAAYEARGPKEGPLVVGSVLLKTDDRDRYEDDLRALIRLNVGG